MKKIDTHQHFWKYNAEEYGWIGPKLKKLQRDFLPDDLAPLLSANDIDGCVSVQARQTVKESQWLLDLADAHSFIKGVVGWVDLCSLELKDQLEHFASHPKFKGIRHVVHDEPDTRFLMRENCVKGIGMLSQYNLTYDLLLFPKHLPVAIELVQQFPEQRFVVDHIAKPVIKAGIMTPWNRDIKTLASYQNVYCKVSGMVTEAEWDKWTKEDFTPYLDVVFETFGPERIMVGSDWPVCTLAAEYKEVMQIPADYIQNLSSDEQAQVWGKTAITFYGLEE